jgi:TPR repeat protein
MTENTSENPADILYAEGMKYDLRQDKSLAAATLARASFQQAASMGHTKAIRALAHMVFEGNGGGKDREQAILMLWSAFLRGDHESLEELVDVLESYAEAKDAPFKSKDISDAARQVEDTIDRLARVKYFIHELVLHRANKNSNE